MKRYIQSANSIKQPYELLGWLIDDNGYYQKVWLHTYAVSEKAALKNFRYQVHENYPGWSIVEDRMNLRLDTGSRYNRWAKLPENAVIIS